MGTILKIVEERGREKKRKRRKEEERGRESRSQYYQSRAVDF